MTEISYIIQDGEQINLKDAKGRELLAEKQVKLKAGRGISIANDGTISVIGSGSSAAGFFINASGDFNNLTFDKTPAEVNTAIEQGNIIIVNANNAKFILTDVKDGTYLFSYLVVSGEEDCLAQMATISATSNESNWSEIKANFVAIKSAKKSEDSSDCDEGNDFSTWDEFDQDSILIYGNKVENDGLVVFKEQEFYDSGWVYPKQYNSNLDIDEEDVANETTGKIIIDGKKYLIADKAAREEYETLQDKLVLSEDLAISEDGEIYLTKEVGNE